MVFARVCTALGVPLLLIALIGGPAAAHGAPTNPVSRSAGCQPEGRWARSAACVAAVATSGKVAWDNLRLANVKGRDRQLVPDGKLCSAGLSGFRGLDLPRADWQTTTMAGGAQVTFTYKGTIPHKGTFRWYLTKDGYSPTRPLRWADLDDAPFLQVKDPPMRNGSYVMAGRLPARTGRHLIYTVWQNSNTPDTYYSCSDVVLTGAAAQPAQPAPASTAAAAPATAGTTEPPTTTAAEVAPSDSATAAPDLGPVTQVSATNRTVPLLFTGAAVLALAAALAAFLLARRRSAGPAGLR
jgi:predicted carbohydrate-binding protein with CBM5 and CBM33 domain